MNFSTSCLLRGLLTSLVGRIDPYDLNKSFVSNLPTARTVARQTSTFLFELVFA